MLIRDGIPVLIDEALNLVLDVDGVVSDSERIASKSRFLEYCLVLGRVELLVELSDKGGIRARWQSRLFVEEGEDSKFTLNDIDAWLVVGKVDECPVDFFANVLLLLKLEDVGVELEE